MKTKAMLRQILSGCLLAFGISSMYAQTSVETTAGKLKEQLTGKDVKQLILSGEMNANDFAFLRDLQGVEVLDLSGIEIVPGGSYTPMYDKIETRPRVMPGFWLFQSELAKSLKEITLPETVKVISLRSLQDGELLTKITLPAELDSIHEMAFGYCTALEEITIPESVKSIGASAFEHCSALEEIELPENLSFLGPFAFSGCASLKRMNLPEGIHKLGSGLFKGCSTLENVEMSKEVYSIGSFCFEKCVGLTEVDLPYMLDTLGHSAFEGCTNLAKVRFYNEGLDSIPSNLFKECSALSEVNIPSNVYYIGPFAFSGCTSLASVVLPASLEVIMGGAFARTALEAAMVPSKVRTIAYGAFARCENLKVATLPSALEELGEVAFAGCEKLSLVYADMPTPLPLDKAKGLESFRGYNSDQEFYLHVPEASLEAYKAAPGWKEIKGLTGAAQQHFVLSDTKRLLDYVALREEGQSLADYLANLGDKVSQFALKDVKISGRWKEEDAKAALEIFPSITQSVDFSELEDPDNLLPSFSWKDCRALVSLKLPKSVTEIHAEQFSGCKSLKSLSMPSLEKIAEDAFSGCQALETLPSLEGLKELESRAFFGCASLKEVQLPKAIVFVPAYVFANCTKLSKITLGAETTDIDEWAFFNCRALTSLTLPATTSEIKERAFYGCTHLERLVVEALTPPDLGDNVFSPWHFQNTELRLMSEGARAEYKEAEGWREFQKVSVWDSTEIMNMLQGYAYGLEGAIVLQSATKVPAAVYSFSGACVARLAEVQGAVRLAVAEGLYIVRLGASSFKVVVR